ncbi:MAG: formate/nitrite transporter family protein [Clostridia bacterium]|nr:formate/nitrite transporter family protein [Clostridia bacterium]
MLRKILDGVLAGIMITVGGSVFLSCYEGNKYVGAIMFSVALLCICFKGYSLFTGKVGYIPERHDKEAFSVLLLGLLGNAIGTIGGGIAVKYATPGIREVANTLCSARLEQEMGQTFIRAVFCGILMYLAVSIFKENKSLSGIFLCVPVFILCGFEHSIANMFYFAASDIVSFEAFGYLWLVIFGNAIGGMLMPALGMIGRKKADG